MFQNARMQEWDSLVPLLQQNGLGLHLLKDKAGEDSHSLDTKYERTIIVPEKASRALSRN